MTSTLANRIDRLAAKLPDPATPPARVICIVAEKSDKANAIELAAAEGYDAEKDIVILNLIVRPAQANEHRAPYVLRTSGVPSDRMRETF